MEIRIAASAYVLPSDSVEFRHILSAERSRIEAALDPLSENLRKRILGNIGVNRVRVCRQEKPYDLALAAARQTIDEAGIRPADIDLIIDFVTLPGNDSPYLSFAQKLSRDLGAEDSLNMSYRVGGCAGLHLAIKNASALMHADESLRTALLVTADSPPQGSRSLLPIAIQGDAGSAVLLVKGGRQGPTLLATEVLTLGHLHDAVVIGYDGSPPEKLVIRVDSARIEKDLMPIYYLNFMRLIDKALAKTGLTLDDMDHFIYSNISPTDYYSFIRALHLNESKVAPARFADLGHTFASDLIINYTDLCRKHQITPGQYLLFASAGIGFTWGVTIAGA